MEIIYTAFLIGTVAMTPMIAIDQNCSFDYPREDLPTGWFLRAAAMQRPVRPC